MSAFSGSQFRGAKRELRKVKRVEAEARNALYRQEHPSQKRATE